MDSIPSSRDVWILAACLVCFRNNTFEIADDNNIIIYLEQLIAIQQEHDSTSATILRFSQHQRNCDTRDYLGKDLFASSAVMCIVPVVHNQMLRSDCEPSRDEVRTRKIFQEKEA